MERGKQGTRGSEREKGRKREREGRRKVHQGILDICTMCLEGYYRFKYGLILLIAWYDVLRLKNL